MTGGEDSDAHGNESPDCGSAFRHGGGAQEGRAGVRAVARDGVDKAGSTGSAASSEVDPETQPGLIEETRWRQSGQC